MKCLAIGEVIYFIKDAPYFFFTGHFGLTYTHFEREASEDINYTYKFFIFLCTNGHFSHDGGTYGKVKW